ncbi:hypothetical protein [Sorangium sp. So ce887]|uniref:hypothetical protein n=1 Tax=Sorangium sp. So ce887 TaxID=3133324 RepID=UPI003F6394A5
MQSGRHAEAQRWFHFMFDSTTGDPAPPPVRFWNVRPFRENKDLASIEDELRELPGSQQGRMARLMGALLTSQDDEPEKLDLVAQIAAWRKDPFSPHLIARMRPIAYQKAVVMKYVESRRATAASATCCARPRLSAARAIRAGTTSASRTAQATLSAW